MIDEELRSKGIGGSEVAAIVGLDPRRDAFGVYGEKLGLVKRAPPSARMKWGRRIERVIAEAYGEETGRAVVWDDHTIANPIRPWQLMTPDAFVWFPGPGASWIAPNVEYGLDCKNVSWDQAPKWGAAGTEQVPEWIACQCHWYCSAADLPYWDIAALFGGNDFRIYRIYRDTEVETLLLIEVEKFWRSHVLARVPPPMGCSQAAADYLKQRFPKNIRELRLAEPEELSLLAQLKRARADFDRAEARKDTLELLIKQAIGDADGLLFPLGAKGKVTWLRNKDSIGTDWEGVASDLCLAIGALLPIAESAYQCPEWVQWARTEETDLVMERARELTRPDLIAAHQVVTREGVRVLRCTWPRTDDWMPAPEPELPKELPPAGPALVETATK
jgi:predicted phage-related endonuclease